MVETNFIHPFVQTLLDYGAVEVLTLVMMITISYAIITKSKLFGDVDASGDTGKRANSIAMVVSLILGFLVFLSPMGRAIDLWFTKFFIHILIVLMAALGTFLLMGFGGYNFSSGLPGDQKWYLLGAVVIVFLIFLNAGGFELFGLQGNEDGVPGSNPVPNALTAIQWTPEVISQIVGAIVVLAIFFGSMGLLFLGGRGGGGSGGTTTTHS